MTLDDHHTMLSRATSRTSHRSRNSSLSRTQSLIKKNIGLIDLKPADVLIERFVAWKVIVNQLASYFEGVADIENNIARELAKLAGVIQVPFRAGNQFLGEGGLQDVYYNIRDKTRIIADQHADLGRTIDSSIVQHLHKLRAEIKAHVKNVQNDTGKLAASVAKERELSTKLVGELANNISTFKNTPMGLLPRNDPYISDQAVARQLQRQVLEENLLQKSIVVMQQNSAHFEEGIVRSIQSAWQTFDEWQSRATSATQEILRSLNTHMSSLAPDREWIQFAARSDHLLDPDTPLRDPSAIHYPLKDDPSVVPVHVGYLGRKRRFTRIYAESYFVLTPAGFLHEFPSSDPTASQLPTFSLFLPTCTLGPPSHTANGHKFHIEGRKDGTGTTKSKTGSLRGLIPIGHNNETSKAWSFRARSRDEMMEWWNDIRMLCSRYLIASEMVDRTGPVEAAVKAAGYNSEDYDEDEVGGEDDVAAQSAGEDVAGESGSDHVADNLVFESGSAPPRYSHAHTSAKKSQGAGTRLNGHPIDNKRHSEYAIKNYAVDDSNNNTMEPLHLTSSTYNADYNRGQHTQPTTHKSPSVKPDSVDGDSMDQEQTEAAVASGRGGESSSRSFSKRHGSPEIDPVSIPDPDMTEVTSQKFKYQTPPSPQGHKPPKEQTQQKDAMAVWHTAPSHETPDDWEEATGEVKSDGEPNVDDIYESDHERERRLEKPPEADNPRSGLISSVAASIGNVVRGATGYS